MVRVRTTAPPGNGTHFLYEAEKRSGSGRRMNLPVGSLDSLASRIVGEADSNAVYSAGQLMYMRQSTLMAQPVGSATVIPMEARSFKKTET
jgi:hypothetical protein